MLKKSYILGLAAAGLIIPSAVFAQNNSVVIPTIPVEATVNPPNCVSTGNRGVFNNKPTSRTISISKQSQSINGVSSSTEVYQSSVSSDSGSVVNKDIFCVLPAGVPGLPQ